MLVGSSDLLPYCVQSVVYTPVAPPRMLIVERAYFGGSQKASMLTVAGERIAVLTSPSGASQIFRDESTFAFEPFIDIVYRGVANVSNKGNSLLWLTPKEGLIYFIRIPETRSLCMQGMRFCKAITETRTSLQ